MIAKWNEEAEEEERKKTTVNTNDAADVSRQSIENRLKGE
jgi:hypothetical protein